MCSALYAYASHELLILINVHGTPIRFGDFAPWYGANMKLSHCWQTNSYPCDQLGSPNFDMGALKHPTDEQKIELSK